MPRQLKRGLALLLYIEIRKYYLILTCPRRLMLPFGWLNPLFLFPLTISNTKTPKLKTSDFVEYNPSLAYSGDI